MLSGNAPSHSQFGRRCSTGRDDPNRLVGLAALVTAPAQWRPFAAWGTGTRTARSILWPWRLSIREGVASSMIERMSTKPPRSLVDAFTSLRPDQDGGFGAVDSVRSSIAQMAASVAGVDSVRSSIAQMAAANANQSRFDEVLTVAADTVLRTARSGMTDTPHTVASEPGGLLQAWADVAQALLTWFADPKVKWPAIGLALYLSAAWYITIKVYRPDIADLIEQPFWVLVALLLQVAAAVRKDGK